MDQENFYVSCKALDFIKQSMHTQMQDVGSIANILHLNSLAYNVPGDIVELGCFEGHTAKLLTLLNPQKNVFVYDSFEGLPPGDKNYKENHQAGIMNAPIENLYSNFENDQIRLPTINQNFFENLSPLDMPDRISFALLDGDLYSSVYTSLELVYNNMSVGGVIIIDDYMSKNWPGVYHAVNNFFHNKIENPQPLSKLFGEQQQCYIIKQ